MLQPEAITTRSSPLRFVQSLLDRVAVAREISSRHENFGTATDEPSASGKRRISSSSDDVLRYKLNPNSYELKATEWL